MPDRDPLPAEPDDTNGSGIASVPTAGVREKIHEIIFGAETFGGILFDGVLLAAIVASIIVISIESIPQVQESPWHPTLRALEWVFTIFFTVEYLLRLYCVRKPLNYAFSFWGIIDLASFLPDYLLLMSGMGGRTHSFSVIRSLRLLRAFRIFKLGWFQNEADDLGNAIWRARAKVIVFITAVMIIVTVSGTLMFEIEHRTNDQFQSIPDGVYWAIVTMTTVGFGDIVPKTVAGKFLSAFLILLGYSLIIVPTGFVSAEIIESRRKNLSTRSCPSCITEGHAMDATYCKYCGEHL